MICAVFYKWKTLYNHGMKKSVKTVSLLLVLFLLFSIISACGKNDTTDEITLKYNYYDGEYIAYDSYFDDEGYAYAMKMVVSEGIITHIFFDKYDTDYKALSNSDDPELQEAAKLFSSDIKSLNSAVFQSQYYSSINDTPVNDEILRKNYYQLAVLLIRAALNEDAEKTISVSNRNTYVRNSEIFSERYTARLALDYSGEYISGISFYITDEYGLKIDSFPIEADETYLSYSEQLRTLSLYESDEISAQKEDSNGNILPELLSVYNKLCNEIEKSRKTFNIQKVHFPSVR